MVKTSIQDRRTAVRAQRILSIQFKIVKTSRKIFDKSWHLSMTHDMSVGGLSFYTEQEMKVGDILDIEVVMSGVLDIFKGLAEVVRLEKRKTGAHYLIALKLIPQKTRSAKSLLPRRQLKSS